MLRHLHDPVEIEKFLRNDPHLHLYSLGDLDPEYWPYTNWYAWGDPVEALVLGYFASHPIFLAHASPGGEAPLLALLEALQPQLPRRFTCHITPGMREAFDYILVSAQSHRKMALTDRSLLKGAEGERLGPEQLKEISEFYAQAYPGNWFEPRILATGQYFGIRRHGRLAAVAGVHVYAPGRRVAALGNIATHPDFRGQGLASKVTARLCSNLLESVDQIGLNVKADNTAAQACYRRLGFEECASYEELVFTVMKPR